MCIAARTAGMKPLRGAAAHLELPQGVYCIADHEARKHLRCCIAAGSPWHCAPPVWHQTLAAAAIQEQKYVIAAANAVPDQLALEVVQVAYQRLHQGCVWYVSPLCKTEPADHQDRGTVQLYQARNVQRHTDWHCTLHMETTTSQ